jgi:glucose-1-phosphate thymidylyltransferase
MKVIIPVAGSGTRLRPHTFTKPKVLMNVAGKPMIYHIVNQLVKDRKANSIIFITGQMSDVFKEYILTTFKYNFEFIEQKEPLGLGHAIYCAKKSFLKNEDSLIILGDTLFDVNLKMLCFNKHSVIGTKKVDDPKRFGVVETDSKGFITRFIEKPASKEISKSNEAIVGIYYIKNSHKLFNALNYIIKNNIKTKNEFQLTDALQRLLITKFKFTTYKVKGWLDCGKPETILETNKYILKKINKKYSVKGNKIIKPVFIGINTRIQNSIIGPFTSISDGSIIINSSIKECIISDNSKIENSNLKNSIIGENCFVKNYRGVLNIGDFNEVYK